MEYFISDLHFGHDNIISFSNRPFSDVKEMDAKIKEKWNNKVKPTDTVYVLGDVSFHNKKVTKIILNLLNGNKVLIKGNHDVDVPKECFMYVKDYHTIKLESTGEKVVLFHYPILEWDGFFKDRIHLYGHVHNTKVIDIPNMYNVGADILDFEPCTIPEIIERNKSFVKKNTETDKLYEKRAIRKSEE